MKGKKMNNVLALETNKYAIKIENFEGPLDLLVHLLLISNIDKFFNAINSLIALLI